MDLEVVRVNAINGMQIITRKPVFRKLTVLLRTLEKVCSSKSPDTRGVAGGLIQPFQWLIFLLSSIKFSPYFSTCISLLYLENHDPEEGERPLLERLFLGSRTLWKFYSQNFIIPSTHVCYAFGVMKQATIIFFWAVRYLLVSVWNKQNMGFDGASSPSILVYLLIACVCFGKGKSYYFLLRSARLASA